MHSSKRRCTFATRHGSKQVIQEVTEEHIRLCINYGMHCLVTGGHRGEGTGDRNLQHPLDRA